MVRVQKYDYDTFYKKDRDNLKTESGDALGFLASLLVSSGESSTFLEIFAMEDCMNDPRVTEAEMVRYFSAYLSTFKPSCLGESDQIRFEASSLSDYRP
jgi:hypothetical protein